MDDKIIEFIIQSISLTDKEIEVIKEQNLIQFHKKGTILLAEGEYAQNCYFVLKGCVRNYHIVDRKLKTIKFYTENQTINPISYTSKQPSQSYLTCYKDTVLAISNEESNKRLLENVPRLESMVARLGENLLAENRSDLEEFKNMSPERRYRKLLESRPDLFQQMPFYHIATYLGITPVLVNRVEKRIAV